MKKKPTTITGYPSSQTALVRSTCLYVATKLGDLLDELVIVGGLVPSLIVDLKALAFDGRGENKDAYDLFYVIRNYGPGIDSVRERLRPLLDDVGAAKAVDILRRDFIGHDAVGPRRVAEFVTGGIDAQIQADVVGFAQTLLKGL